MILAVTIADIVMMIVVFVAGLAVTLSTAAFGFAFTFSRKVTALETKMEVVWPQVKFVTAMGLHSPDDHRGIDELLMKYIKGTIRHDELAELVDRVKIIAASGSEDEQIRAQGLLKMIKVEYQV